MLNLSFVAKKAIVRTVIEKVVGNKEKLVISGYIPLKNIYVKTSDRYGRELPRYARDSLIPFTIEIGL